MSIINHKFNRKMSEKVFKDCKSVIKQKECYNNVFHIFNDYSTYGHKFHSGEWKIAYGYIRIIPNENLLARHCFIIDEKGYAIDPTLFCIKNVDGNKDHMSFKIFDNMEEYLNAITRNDNCPDLIHYLRKVERPIIKQFLTQNLYVL